MGKVVLRGYWRAKVNKIDVAVSKPTAGRINLFIIAPGDMAFILHQKGVILASNIRRGDS